MFNENAGTTGDPNYQDIENLTIFETETVVSALDIYWETTQAGLISDLNWDVAVGFDGPVSINPTFSFEETDIIGTALTQDFFPLDKLGSQIINTTATMVASSVRLGITTDFELISLPSGDYRIQNTVGYEYINNSFTQDVFTFDITFNQAANQPTTWGKQTLSFTGSLTTNTPSFTIATPNPYYFYDDTYVADQVIHDFGGQADSVNGASTDSDQTAGLRWTILPTGNESGYFDINATSGELILTTAGLASGNNSYPITIRLEDASLAGATPGAGSLHDDQNITVIKGYPQSDSYVSSIANKSWTSQSEDKTSGCSSPTNIQIDNICCYISDTTISNSNLPNFGNSGSFVAVTNPTPCGAGPIPINIRDAYRIGNSQSVGEFAFGIEDAKVTYFQGICGSQPSGTQIKSIITMRVYHTEEANPTSSDWTRVADINGLDGQGPFDPSVGDFVEYMKLDPTFFNSGASGASPIQNVYFAGNTPGKYAF